MTLPFSEQRDIKPFLESGPTWQNRIPDGWVGTKFLGKGGFGVTGLWEYKGDPAKAPAITKVVIKMTELLSEDFQGTGVDTRPKKDRLFEGRILERLSQRRNGHVVRSFGGNRLGDRFGDMREVVKIFMEFCPGGDVDVFLPKSYPIKGEVGGMGLEEVDLWALFCCMAEGVVVIAEMMDRTTGYAGFLRKRELAHMDLKPDNADFGEAMDVREVSRQDDEYGGQTFQRGFDSFRPPEEVYRYRWSNWDTTKYPIKPRKGNCSNIWQIGAIMNSLITRRRLNFNPANATEMAMFYPDDRLLSRRPLCSDVLKTNHNSSQYLEPEYTSTSTTASASTSTSVNRPTTSQRKRRRTLTLSRHHEEAQAQEQKDEGIPIAGKTYSNALLNLTQECLLREPLLRPTYKSLFKRAKLGYENAKKSVDPKNFSTAKDQTLPPPLFDLGAIPFEEPFKSEPPSEFLYGAVEKGRERGKGRGDGLRKVVGVGGGEEERVEGEGEGEEEGEGEGEEFPDLGEWEFLVERDFGVREGTEPGSSTAVEGEGEGAGEGAGSPMPTLRSGTWGSLWK
ncbi:hypothetical protein HYFRA_00009601 [Hymenoscyphus fraxineus]|uniref:Protein kinase domain-containing protein n=1 Tax=Hymenoscyphus fraxineus TaxID=746836 RepID=A0A9N9L237_9HELO|nr:hypothetical protein HYFRA_00009601 [Hymenoscyphus fraxineus]